MLPILITFSVMVASATLMETALSFMELGDSNTVSWGRVIGAGRELLRTAWELTTLPGLLIVVTVLALKLIGDGLLGTWASLPTGKSAATQHRDVGVSQRGQPSSGPGGQRAVQYHDRSKVHRGRPKMPRPIFRACFQ